MAIPESVLPYLRADHYTPFLCSTLSQSIATAKPYIETTVNQGQDLLAPLQLSSHFENLSAFVPYQVSDHFPQITSTISSIVEKLPPIPHSSVETFCEWFQHHAFYASENALHIVQHPKELFALLNKDFYTQSSSQQLTLLSDSPSTFSLQHITQLISVYFLVIFVIYSSLSILSSVLGMFFSKKTYSSDKPIPSPLFLYGIEIFHLSEMLPEWGVTVEEWYDKHLNQFHQSEENALFVKKVHENSGLATTEKTHLPPQVTEYPPNQSIVSSRKESFLYITNILDKVFKNYAITPKDVDVLVINCSLFNPTPSHCAMAINHYKMRNDIICYAIHGMGCSASAIAVNACKDALACHPKPNPIGIVISFENLTLNFYHGKERSMLVSNALFRMGVAGMVFGRQPTLTVNRHTYKAQYELEHLVRTHIGAKDEAYRCIWQEEDGEGKRGVRLSKDVPKIAGGALTINLTTLATRILPYRALIAYGIRFLINKITRAKKSITPNFLTAVDHICIHAGGRGVIDAIETDLELPKHITQPSRDILRAYGNQSSASIWYIFQHLHKDVKRGQKVWQITFGSGFKCNSLIWRRL